MRTRQFAVAAQRVAIVALASVPMGALSGCASAPRQPAVTAQAKANQAILAKLSAYADSAAQSLQSLAEMEQAAHTPGGGTPVHSTTPPGLQRRVSIDWDGPLTELVQRMAQASGYTLQPAIGTRPALPLIVAVSETNATVASVLREAGAQAGSAANIVLDPDARSVHIQYAPDIRTGTSTGAGAARRTSSNRSGLASVRIRRK